MSLVDYNGVEIDFSELFKTDVNSFIGGDENVEVLVLYYLLYDFFSLFLASNQSLASQTRQPFFEFFLPVADNAVGADHEMGSFDALLILQEGHERNGLDSFS